MLPPAAPARRFDRRTYDNALLLRLYRELLRPRLIEENILILLRQGKLSKWFSGIGQEAVAVGSTLALNPDEYILPLHRHLGVFTSRQVPLGQLFAQWLGKATGFTKGRDKAFYFGSHAHHIVGMLAHLGPQLAVADGIALADTLDQAPRVTLAYAGNGQAGEGDFQEALTVAAAWQLPVIFLVEHHAPSDEQSQPQQAAHSLAASGLETIAVDGNNVLEVYHTIATLAADLRQHPRPVIVAASTFQLRGHAETAGTQHVPSEQLEAWGRHDPVENYEKWLLAEGILSETARVQLRERTKQEIDQAWQEAEAAPAPTPDAQRELAEMYAPAEALPTDNQPTITQPVTATEQPPSSPKSYLDAIREGLEQALEQYPQLVLMGQDIAEYGGLFRATEGLAATFGKARVRDTPLCESAILGATLGLAVRHKKSMVEVQFADFVSCGFNQIVNNLAKSYYRWGQPADVVVRLPTGAGTAAGPFYSQSTEAWFTHVPGLRVVYPSNPHDAKGLLLSAFQDPNPVLFFEHKLLYRSVSGPVPTAPYTTPLGQAALAAEGHELSIVTYGLGVHWALAACQELGIEADILDLRTLLPWDHAAVARTVQKTGRLLVLHEDTLIGGLGGEIAAWVAEHCFSHLDAPVRRVAALDTAVPFAPQLEADFLPTQRLRAALQELRAY